MSLYAAASSTHPLATQAAGEVLGSILDAGLDFEPDFAFLSISAQHRGSFEDIAKAVRHVLGPKLLIGQSGSPVIANGREFESTASIALLAGNPGEATPVRLSTKPASRGVQLLGLDAAELAAAHSLLLIADPSSLPIEGLLGHLQQRQAHLKVFGAATGPASQLLLGDQIHQDGAVGFLLSGKTRLLGFSSTAVRPIGQAYTVTGVTETFIRNLAGRPANELFDAVLGELQIQSPLIRPEHLRLGIYPGETGGLDGQCRIRTFQRHEEHGLQIGTRIGLGTVVQFHILDQEEATIELHSRLLGLEGEAAIVFNSLQRGSGFFTESHHDAMIVSEALDEKPTAGFASAFEITSTTGTPIVQQTSASAAVFIAP